MTVEAIKAEISHLSEQERKELSDWVEELGWDEQIARGFALGGRAVAWAEKVRGDITAGKFTSLEEGLRARRVEGR